MKKIVYLYLTLEHHASVYCLHKFYYSSTKFSLGLINDNKLFQAVYKFIMELCIIISHFERADIYYQMIHKSPMINSRIPNFFKQFKDSI